MYRKLIVRLTQFKPCTAIDKNLISVIPTEPFHPHIPCAEPNQETQIDFGGPTYGEKGNEIYFLAALDGFSKYLTAYPFDNANGPISMRFLEMYIANHGVLRTIRLDQAKWFVGHIKKISCNRSNKDFIEAPVNDHRAIGLVESSLQN